MRGSAACIDLPSLARADLSAARLTPPAAGRPLLVRGAGIAPLAVDVAARRARTETFAPRGRAAPLRPLARPRPAATPRRPPPSGGGRPRDRRGGARRHRGPTAPRVVAGGPDDRRSGVRTRRRNAAARRSRACKRFEAARGFPATDGSAPPYQRIAELTFEDMDALQAGFGSDEGQAAANDLPNFATGGVTIFFAEID